MEELRKTISSATNRH